MHKIAIIDDEPIFQLFLENDISSEKHECFLYSDFYSFLDKLAEDPTSFDVVIVDRIIGNEDAVDHRFPESCRQMGYKGLIYLYTNFCPSKSNFDPSIDFDGMFKKGQRINWHSLFENKKYLGLNQSTEIQPTLQ